jgi:MFS family permease
LDHVPQSAPVVGLALIALAQFMVIMETSIIGVALPETQNDLGFTPSNMSWVFNAYVVAFGGLLLLFMVVCLYGCGQALIPPGGGAAGGAW